ncbi:MAG: hypothetical protein ABI251_00975 [Mycobacteriaceae bacterium]
MPVTTLDTSDAIELTEMLQFLADWLAADPEHLDASLTRFVGHPAHSARQLRANLHRFRFLLGGDDGEQLFGEHTSR